MDDMRLVAAVRPAIAPLASSGTIAARPDATSGFGDGRPG